MSGEEVVQILNEEIEELIVGLAEGMDESYSEIRQIISEDEDPGEAMETVKELVRIMSESGRIDEKTSEEIIRRLEE